MYHVDSVDLVFALIISSSSLCAFSQTCTYTVPHAKGEDTSYGKGLISSEKT